MEIPAERKPSQVMAWLGFGISLALFLMIWGVNALMFSLIGNKEALVFTTLLMLFIPVGGFLGLMGLTFSIIGLVQATKNYLRKWPSVWGIIFCCLSVISVLSPVIIAATLKNKTLEIEQPEQEEATWTDSKIELFITDDNTIKCYDNRYGEDDNPDVISLNSINKKQEFETWMQRNNISKDEGFIINTDTYASYSDIVEVIDLLSELNILHYRIGSDHSAR